jgi:hypothetical protein
VRQNLYPTFLNDRSADKDRVRSRETSASKPSRILTPSKIISDLISRTGSKSKTDRQIEPEALPEPEPMAQFWEIMNQKNIKNEAKRLEKDSFMKSLFDQRQKTLQG